MRSATEILRAQSRAFITVLTDYDVGRHANDQIMRFWHGIDAFGRARRDARDLATLHLDFHDPAFEACVCWSPGRHPRDALMLALFAFCEKKPSFRFLQPSAYISSIIEKQSSVGKREQSEIMESLEDAFDAEMFRAGAL